MSTSSRVKLPPCCARKETQISRLYGELRQAARKAARSPGSKRLQDAIAEVKGDLARAKEARDLHVYDDTLEHG